jgi:hypothetical protein
LIIVFTLLILSAIYGIVILGFSIIIIARLFSGLSARLLDERRAMPFAVAGRLYQESEGVSRENFKVKKARFMV